ncbi:MAG: glycerol-3-phosphate dehydrogenase [Planctomycetota bacterium]
MSQPNYDILVVGAGIHGVGVLQAAAAAGMRALCLEARSVAAGTSSRSSKLIHGGLRYLESGQLRLVRESLHERNILLQIAPDLVRMVPFTIPVYSDTSRGAHAIRAGLGLYALLGGMNRDARFRVIPRREWDTLDGLELDGLRKVFQYKDGQTDDAQLSRAVARSAVELGARLELPAEVLRIERDSESFLIRYRTPAGETSVRASTIVNAGGPWAEALLDRVHPSLPDSARRQVELVAGSHLEFPGALASGCFYTEAEDRRAVFVMPWHGHTLVGTTERPYAGDPARIEPTEQEETYLTQTYARHFPSRNHVPTKSWAGLRVLPTGSGSAFGRPREVDLACDPSSRPCLVTIYGGKLTGYRSTAQKVMQCLAPYFEHNGQRFEPRADTATTPLTSSE